MVGKDGSRVADGDDVFARDRQAQTMFRWHFKQSACVITMQKNDDEAIQALNKVRKT